MAEPYLSHPVRHIRDDPVVDESASLVVELAADEHYDELVATVTDLDGSVDRDLGFSSHLVTLPQTAVADLCTLDFLDRVETADTISLGVEPEATEGVGDDE